MAWLHSYPRDKQGKAQERSRLANIEAKGDVPLLPPNDAPYLTSWLFELGPTVHGGIGETPLGYQDLLAWQEITGIQLMPWEAKVLRGLSHDYLNERQQAEELSRPAPYTGEPNDILAKRDLVSRQIKSAFGQLKKKD